MMSARLRRPPAQSIDKEFVAAVLAGLTRSPKEISPKFFYDARGSQLFEQITALPEYYPTRTEIAILDACASKIAQRTVRSTVLVEFGSGSSRKTELLLSKMPDLAAYVAVDLSASALQDAVQRLAVQFPGLQVVPIVADFTRPFALPETIARAPKLGFFPGSTIGNFTPEAARQLLTAWRGLLGLHGRLVIGVDLEKSPDILIPAYDDAQGVTAQFNLNLLQRINSEFGADFDLTQFAHEARWNGEERRIEMHLVSRRAQTVQVLGQKFTFASRESIHTENSYKYTVPRFQELARSASWTARETWLDPDARFSVHEFAGRAD